VSVEASCSGLKSEKSRAANYGHYQLLGGNNNVRNKTMVIPHYFWVPT
jgi:hypothetical protein